MNYAVPSRRASAWMNILWAILNPKVVNTPEDVVPILILDSFRFHMITSVVQKIQNLGVKVGHIPVCCIGLCPHIDIGVNKLFKIISKDSGKVGWFANALRKESQSTDERTHLKVDN